MQRGFMYRQGMFGGWRVTQGGQKAGGWGEKGDIPITLPYAHSPISLEYKILFLRSSPVAEWEQGGIMCLPVHICSCLCSWPGPSRGSGRHAFCVWLVLAATYCRLLVVSISCSLTACQCGFTQWQIYINSPQTLPLKEERVWGSPLSVSGQVGGDRKPPASTGV